ncbi:MAG: N-6 DNA methylase [Treponema sp.]|nr:N-6 DNA methylase [Treponema sp.]
MIGNTTICLIYRVQNSKIVILGGFLTKYTGKFYTFYDLSRGFSFYKIGLEVRFGGRMVSKDTLQNIFTKLNLADDALIRLSNKKWKEKVRLSNRISRFLEQTSPDAFFCLDNKPMILFYNDPTDKKKLHKQIWNFNEAPIIIIIERGNIEIFNGFSVNEKGADKGFLVKIGNHEKLDDFTYFKLVTGKTWEIYKDELTYRNRVDYRLLTNIKDAREFILSKFPKTKSEKTKKLYAKTTNALLGKIIFVRYLIDRKVILNFDKQSKIWTNDDFCVLLQNPKKTQKFFYYLADKKIGFNGDLFTINEDEYSIIPNDAYNILIGLLQSKDMGTGQLSLFDLYDFSVIPIEFISNVYESFLGIEKKEEEQKEDKKKNKKDDDGVHYTPLFLVDYILSETVEKYLSKIKDINCKVLDPACGSGVFLVETLRKLIERYKKQNKQIYENNKEKFKEDIKDIAIKNIFGIDKDASAVQVAIFSIYLTLLDYLNPPEIKTFKFPELLGTNFFCADFFDKETDFNDKLYEKDFAFIIGNPPWMRGKNEKKSPLYVNYIKERKKEEKIKGEPVVFIGNKEIAQAFLLRTKDFSNVKTKCALIVTSKTLYNLQSKDFRKYFLHNYLIERVFELAPVRHEVFDKSNDKAIAPACVLFFNYANGQNTDKNIIEFITLKPSRFFSMFKIFSINHHDIKTVQQNRVKEHDWVWKILVYGSYLDFNFIKRLKNDYPTIKKYINDSGNFIVGQGIMVGGGDENDVSYLIGRQYIDTKKDIRQFWINPDNHKTWQYNIVHRQRNKKLFKAPMLLITGGVTNELKSVSAVCYKDSVYRSSLTGIKSKTKGEIDILRQIAGLLNSSLFSYYNLMTFSSSCIEREESHDKETLDFPFFSESNISHTVKNIEELLSQKYKTVLEDSDIQPKVEEKYNELNNLIYNAFSVTEEEMCLLDYTKNIIIPIQMQHENYEKHFQPIQLDDIMLNDYATIFIERFKSSFISVDKQFIVEIWYTQQIIGMFFKIIPAKEYTQNIIYENKQNDESGIINFIGELSSKKITDKLFIQKDIRGFQKDYFYIFKPNEKRLWHKAVGYLDVYEFADAILQAGRDKVKI